MQVKTDTFTESLYSTRLKEMIDRLEFRPNARQAWSDAGGPEGIRFTRDPRQVHASHSWAFSPGTGPRDLPESLPGQFMGGKEVHGTAAPVIEQLRGEINQFRF